MEKKRNKWLSKIIVVALILAALIAYKFVPSVHDGFDKIADMFCIP